MRASRKLPVTAIEIRFGGRKLSSFGIVDVRGILNMIDSRCQTCVADRKSGVVGRAFVGRDRGDNGGLIVAAELAVCRWLARSPGMGAADRGGRADVDTVGRGLDWTRRSDRARPGGGRLLARRQARSHRGS